MIYQCSECDEYYEQEEMIYEDVCTYCYNRIYNTDSGFNDEDEYCGVGESD